MNEPLKTNFEISSARDNPFEDQDFQGITPKDLKYHARVVYQIIDARVIKW